MKSIFTQIFNEWRTNLWLAIELLVVSVVMWYIADFLYVKISTLNEPRGFDTEHCYRIDFAWLNSLSADYVVSADSKSERTNTLQQIVDRLQHRPEIESVALSINAYPYNNSSSNDGIRCDSVHSAGYILRRLVTPDFLRVFRYEGVNGETSEQLADMLRGNNIMLSDNVFRGQNRGIYTSSVVGHQLVLDSDTSSLCTLVASLKTVRHNDYTTADQSKCVVVELPQDYFSYANELCVRVRADMDRDFIQTLMADSESQFRIGNFYICGVRSFDTIRDNYQRMDNREVGSYVVGMMFLLVNIFLGLLGTFWFRTQQRVGEIAVRKVSGATRIDVFGRLMAEGVVLLTIVTPLAMAVDANLANMELNSWYAGTYLSWPRLMACAAAVYALMAVMVMLGIYFPARRAMRIEPADALRDE